MLEKISNWWPTLDPATQSFYVVGGIAFVVVCYQTISTFLSSAKDGPIVETKPVSFRTLAMFLMGFGIVGGLILQAGKPISLALVGGVLVGILLSLIIFLFMRILRSVRSLADLDLTTAKGLEGKVVTTILPNCAEGGQVELILGGRSAMFPAISTRDEEIIQGAKVRVLKAIPPNVVVVERV